MSEVVVKDDGIAGDEISDSEKPSFFRIQMNLLLGNSKYTDFNHSLFNSNKY